MAIKHYSPVLTVQTQTISVADAVQAVLDPKVANSLLVLPIFNVIMHLG